jgi:hypothetical protein
LNKKNPKNRVSYKEMMHHKEDALLKFMEEQKDETKPEEKDDTKS